MPCKYNYGFSLDFNYGFSVDFNFGFSLAFVSSLHLGEHAAERAAASEAAAAAATAAASLLAPRAELQLAKAASGYDDSSGVRGVVTMIL